MQIIHFLDDRELAIEQQLGNRYRNHHFNANNFDNFVSNKYKQSNATSTGSTGCVTFIITGTHQR